MAVFPPTDWGDWTPEEYQVGAPATALHFERWFRNVVAAFQGATGAPRLAIGALDRLAVGDVPRGETETGTVSYGPSGGSSGTQRFPVFMFLQAGDVRLVVNRSGIEGSCSLIRRRNKSDVTVLSTSLASGDSTPVDVSVLPGDALVLSMSISSGGGSGSLTAYVKIFTDGSNLWPGLPASIIGNTYNA